jgi:hypothetical protein
MNAGRSVAMFGGLATALTPLACALSAEHDLFLMKISTSVSFLLPFLDPLPSWCGEARKYILRPGGLALDSQ